MNNVYFPYSDKEAKKNGITNRFAVNEQAEFPKRLKKLREDKGETLEVAAKAIGITRSTLGLYEKGENVPDVKVIVRIASHYRATTNYLLGEDERPNFDSNYICTQTGLSDSAVNILMEIESENFRNMNIMRKGSAMDLPRSEDNRIAALNVLISSDYGLQFLLALHQYVMGDFKWVSLFDDYDKHLDANGFSSDLDKPGFLLEVFESKDYSHHHYDGHAFLKLLRDSGMTNMQEMIIKMREEYYASLDQSASHYKKA